MKTEAAGADGKAGGPQPGQRGVGRDGIMEVGRTMQYVGWGQEEVNKELKRKGNKTKFKVRLNTTNENWGNMDTGMAYKEWKKLSLPGNKENIGQMIFT